MRTRVALGAILYAATILVSPAFAGKRESSTASERVSILSCPAAEASRELIVTALEQRPAPDKPAAVVIQRGDAALNTFAVTEISVAASPACTVIAEGMVIGRDVSARIPRDTCSSNEKMVATDLMMVELSAPLVQTDGELRVVADGKDIGRLVAMAGTRALVNTRGVAVAKLRRAAETDALTEKVRRREVSLVAHDERPPESVAVDPMSVESLLSRTIDGGRPLIALLDEPFVVVGKDACEVKE